MKYSYKYTATLFCLATVVAMGANCVKQKREHNNLSESMQAKICHQKFEEIWETKIKDQCFQEMVREAQQDTEEGIVRPISLLVEYIEELKQGCLKLSCKDLEILIPKLEQAQDAYNILLNTAKDDDYVKQEIISASRKFRQKLVAISQQEAG